MGSATVGNSGTAIMFASFLVGAFITGLCVFAYLSHCVLVALEATAAGADEVAWPDDTYIAWMGEALIVAYLSLICLLPVGLVAGVWPADWWAGQTGLRVMFFAGVSSWLFFPVAALSCLTAESRWIVFRPIIVQRMVQLLPWTLLFYAASGVVLIIAIAPLSWSLTANAVTLFLTVPLTSAMVLIYPRLLGIFAFKIGKLGPLDSAGWNWAGPRRAKGARYVPPAHAQEPLNRSSSAAKAKHDPDLAYSLADPSQPAFYERPTATAALEPEYEDDESREAKKGYGLGAEHAANPTIAQDYLKPRTANGQPARRPKHAAAAYLGGVLGFPWYRTTLPIWLRLSLGSFVLSWLLVGALWFMPF